MSTYESRLQELVRKDAAKRLAKHEATLLMSHGDLYRHYRCQAPGTWIDGFDIVAWPEAMCYTGDMGDYVFRRAPDMIGFMSRACRDPGYSAEKCIAACNDAIREFKVEVFNEELDAILAEDPERVVKTFRGSAGWQFTPIAEAIDGIKRQKLGGGGLSAIEAMYDSGIWDGGDLPDCKAFTYRFLWCLEAIKWFCGKVIERAPDAEAACAK